ncbi:MAG: transcriptional regulator [Muribaculaceae bacterium]|nr:transcriptional regulator [Muribaculaceae bacterium]
MKKLFDLLLIITICGLGNHVSAATSDINNLFNRLDSMILSKDESDALKQKRILSLMKQREAANTLNSRFALNSALYDEYYIYNADSAKIYVEENLKIAKELGDNDLITDLKIKKSFLEAATGMLLEATNVLHEIDSSKLSHELKKDYYGQMVYIYGLLGNYTSLNSGKSEWNHYYDKEKVYKDSLRSILVPGDRDYLWHLGWNARELPKLQQDSVVKVLTDEVEKSSLNNREVARIAYALAILYKDQENHDKYLEYLVKSAIADVAIGNREVASLADLSKVMFESNNIDRAYTYSSYSLDAALKYPNRVRAITILPLQNQINTAYRELSQKNEAQKRHLIIALCILAFVLACAIFIIFAQLRRMKIKNNQISETNDSLHKRNNDLTEIQNELAETNDKLQNLNKELKSTNESLREANYVKEQYVGYVFAMCSIYIKKMESLRQSINAKATKKQWKDIEEMTEGYQAMTKAELKEFHENFDSIFLHIFPDFVSEFNSLLRPDEQIKLKEGELLNTDLRIYALVRLGITDSVKIAEFLHCSPQTVYNYRFRTRSKALGSKTMFAENVRNIGRVAYIK